MKKNFKKELMMVLIWVFAVFALSAVSVQAAINLDTPDPPLVFAKEIPMDASTGTDLTNAANALDIEVEFGFGSAEAVTRYVRFNLSNGAKFAAAPAYFLDMDADGVQDVGEEGVNSQGGNGDSYVIFSVQTSGAVASDIKGIFQCTIYKVFNNSPVGMTFSHYETGTNAIAQSGALSTQTATVIDFKNLLSITKDSVDTERIDVTLGSINFENPDVADTTVIGDVNISWDTAILWSNGVAPTGGITDIIGATTTLVVNGDFSACQNTDGTYPSQRVFIDLNGGCDDNDVNAATLSASEAVITTGEDLAEFVDDSEICMIVNGVTTISEGSYTAIYKPAPGNVVTLTDVSVGEISTLEKNGSSAQKTFVLNDSDAYSCYVRITNPSGISGSVFITMYNDNGDSVTFDLNQVSAAGEVMTGGNLKAGASTPLIPIADLYAAAQAADSTFAVSGASKKLRFNAEAEFGSNALGDMTGIVVNVLAMARDGNSFFMLP